MTAEVESRQRQRQLDYDQSCNAIYRQTDLDLLPRPFLARDILNNWSYGGSEYKGKPTPRSWGFDKPGLCFHGSTGTGKTRVAHLLLQREAISGVKAISAVQWAGQTSQRAKECKLDGWCEEALDVCGYLPELVLIDDIDKVKATDTVKAELYSLIEFITSNEIPLIVTTNTRGMSFADKLGEDYGKPIVRRICEFCTRVNFDNGTHD